MTDISVLLVLVIFIGAFIAKYCELFVALLGLIKWLAIPLLIVGIFWALSKLGLWLALSKLGLWLMGTTL